ncbi:MAG: zinc metalloprotease HtpX [Myxococcaceae bacterium]
MNQLKTVLLLGVLSALLVWLGGLLGPSYAYTFAFIAVAMNFFAYFFSDKLVLRAHGARETTPSELPAVHRLVEELSSRAQMPKPRVFFIDDANPNAFATGRNPTHGAVAVTRGILERLDERELRGVLAHELAHIRNRDVLLATVAAGIATAISSLAHFASFAAFSGRDDEEGSGFGGLAMALVAPFAATLIQLGVSRAREFQADKTGAEISQDTDALASALQKLDVLSHRIPSQTATPATASLFIVNPLSAGGLAGLFSTHPPMAERIARLRSLTVH